MSLLFRLRGRFLRLIPRYSEDVVTITLDFNRQALALRKDFLIAGACCHLSTNSNDILRAADRCLPVRKHTAAHSFEMHIVVDAALDGISERPAHFRGLRHLVFVILPPRSFLTYDLVRRRANGVLSTIAASDDFFWNRLLLPITLGVLGTHFGVVPLHCACLERNGSAFLVAGASGAGKSTLAAALAQRGFSFISDEWTYVSEEQSSLVAHGLTAPIKLLPDAVQFFPQLRQFSPRRTLNGELAYEIDPVHSIGFNVKRSASPQLIFFLERTSTLGCHMVPCRPQYAGDFFEKSAERLPDELTEAKSLRASIIRSLSAFPSWILRTGEDPHRTAEAIDNFLAKASHARP